MGQLYHEVHVLPVEGRWIGALYGYTYFGFCYGGRRGEWLNGKHPMVQKMLVLHLLTLNGKLEALVY